MASIPMISSACSTAQQSSASEPAWNSPGSWALAGPAGSLGRREPFTVAGCPGRASPCSWPVFTLTGPLFELLPKSTPFFWFSLEKSKEVSKEEDRVVVFLSDSPREGVVGPGWATAEL